VNSLLKKGKKEAIVKMMVSDDGETPSEVQNRRSLLTMDQRNGSKDLFISISGLIGAGKSTLATKLAEKMDLPCFYEPVIDNAYLGDFYRDPARYSFPLQVRWFYIAIGNL